MNRNSYSIRRRHLLSGVASTAAALLTGRVSCAQADASALLAVSYEDAGRSIPSDFIGLSYESASLAGGNYFAPDNASVLGLIGALGRDGVIRIGGNTSERTVWRAQSKSSGSEDIVITPASIDRLAATMRMLEWKLIYGLNLARGTPENAAEEAAYVARALGSNLLAFQIGNEPDGFGRWTAVRPKTYDAAAFLAEWRKFHKAIRARLPDARFAGPDVAGETDWVAALAEEHPGGLVLLTRHYYADGPAGAPHVSLAKLLRSDGQILPVLEQLAHCSRVYGLPYRIVEANSVYNEGQPGVSDTLGAALWGLHLMFEAAAAGAAGVNFHAGVHNRRPNQDKAYTPIARSSAGKHKAAPLYYGMLAFAQMAKGALVPARIAPASAEFKAFAVRDPEENLRLCLINKDFRRSAHVTIDAGRTFAAGSLMRLIGPAADASAGITLGGASVDEFGTWAPANTEVVRPSGRELSVDVPASSAVLISMHL
jgi:Glycosyl hydrolase family 79 C-terminal beta domain